jgi:hypothetical protein
VTGETQAPISGVAQGGESGPRPRGGSGGRQQPGELVPDTATAEKGGTGPTAARPVPPPIECECYPSGFSPASYEGPQEHCLVHGRCQAYFLTFGVGYARRPHPRGSWVHPDGWVTIVAPSHAEARRIAVDLFGICWDDLYDAGSFAMNAHLFTRGELLRVVVPAGLIETEDHRV